MDLIQIIEIVAVILGLGNVYFLAQQKLIAWPLGLAMVTLYAYIFYQSNLLSDFLLHLIYIILNIYGWWYWTHGHTAEAQPPVTLLKRIQQVLLVLSILFGAAIWGFIMDRYTTADFAYADAFTTVASLFAQYLMAKKKIENWPIWITVNVVAMQIYFLKGLYPTSFLYMVFLGLAIFGFRQWRYSMRMSSNVMK